MGYTVKQITETKERLADLRNSRGLSLKQLSTEIEIKEGFHIATSTLGNHECTDDSNAGYSATKGMRLDAFLALADYYKVSPDYLLGRSKAKTNNPDYKKVSDTLHLSNSAIDNIRNIVNNDSNHADSSNYVSRIEILNEMLSSPIFAKLLDNIAEAKLYKNRYYSFEDQTSWDESGNHSIDKEMMMLSVLGHTQMPDADYNKASDYCLWQASRHFSSLLDLLYGEPIPPINTSPVTDADIADMPEGYNRLAQETSEIEKLLLLQEENVDEDDE